MAVSPIIPIAFMVFFISSSIEGGTEVYVHFETQSFFFEVSSTYLSFNIDTGSLYNNLDFSDKVLTQLFANLVNAAPTQLRIGLFLRPNIYIYIIYIYIYIIYIYICVCVSVSVP